MSKVKALLVGVSEYRSRLNLNNLPFCKNDVIAMKKALMTGLAVNEKDIIVCGETGTVNLTDFLTTCANFFLNAEEDDILIFYYSGHGGGTKHCFCLSDSFVKTQEMIDLMERVPSKSKILFLDCCHAGNFAVDGSAEMDISQTIDDFVGKGYAVLASSNSAQSSYPVPDKSISLFTANLCYALSAKFLIKNGKKKLYDIHNLLFLTMDIWNRRNPGKVQTPIYRANIGGTITFDVEDYKPYMPEKYYDETEKYIIYDVEPVHAGQVKRFSVKIILKEPLSLEEISTVNHEIIEKVRSLNISKNKNMELRWKNRKTNIVFCYFGLDETDVSNGIFLCRTTWVDETQDKSQWYGKDKNTEIIDDICFNINTGYDFIKRFTEQNIGNPDELIADTKAIIFEMITNAEKFIANYNDYKNGDIDEATFVEKIKPVSAEIHKLYNKHGNLDIPPNEMIEWSQLCTNLVSVIDDFALYYTGNFLNRSPENRKSCMKIALKRYYKCLEDLKNSNIQ